MRVALFVETYYPFVNGVVTHVKILKEGLEKQGHEVLIVTADPNVRHHYIEDGVLHCPSLALKKAYDYGLASPYSRTRDRMLKDFDPDIIHVHQEFGVGLSGVRIAKRLNVPLVYTLHTMYDDYMYYLFPSIMIPLTQRIMKEYSRYIGRRAYSITGPSKKVEEYLQSDKVNKHINVIPNPVETDLFNFEKVSKEQKHKLREELGADPEKTMISFCGRLGHEKNVDLLLDMFHYVISKKPNYQLMIIGDGPVREELKEQAEKLGIEKDVFFVGKVKHENLPPYYAISGLYVTASTSDTNSISMLEGMSMGLPVLHIRDDLNKGQVVHKLNGYIYENKEELLQAIEDFEALGKEGRAKMRIETINIARRSGADTLATNLLEIYNQCLEKK